MPVVVTECPSRLGAAGRALPVKRRTEGVIIDFSKHLDRVVATWSGFTTTSGSSHNCAAAHRGPGWDSRAEYGDAGDRPETSSQ
jgi:hypothetical protein